MTSAPVAIVDHSLGNLFSVEQACRQSGLSASITADPNEIDSAEALILPGVGAFRDAMRTLRERNLVSAITRFANSGRPTIGVCLGFQLFMDASTEFGEHEGLGLIPGTVRNFSDKGTWKLRTGREPRVPQIGWNKIRRNESDDSRTRNQDPWSGTPLAGLKDDTHMYFVHSYYVVPEITDDALAFTSYEGFTYCSAAARGNVFGCQFHPERSGQLGLAVYENIAKLLRGRSVDD